MDLLWHGLKSFNKDLCLYVKSKIKQRVISCDVNASWLASLSRCSLKCFKNKQSILSVCLNSIQFLYRVPLFASVKQARVIAAGTINHLENEVSNNGWLNSIAAKQVLQINFQAANAPYLSRHIHEEA